GDIILRFNEIDIIKMTDLPRVVAESDIGSVANVEIWRKNKKIIIQVELGELPEQTFTKKNLQNKEKKIEESFVKSLGITVTKTKDSKGVLVNKVNSETVNLVKGDIILEVNREIVSSIKSLLLIVDKYKETGRSSLLLKIQRGEEKSWVTIKFLIN
ncbi:MAG: hypothetical protein HOC10_01540, partial [Pelagibacteraceae bacterium]|nr:hypothetical protein [Pelagibacteraceae bacterium]